jgi:glucosamine--fructose-6-phosphate aminotransferase (isomerizing)
MSRHTCGEAPGAEGARMDELSRVAGKDDPVTLMQRETEEVPAAIGRLLNANRSAFSQLAGELRASPPAVVVTCARGSSDHAATYGKYLIETQIGVPVASAAPSVASRYDSPLHAAGALCIATSQSGRSPDLLITVDAYRKAGARAVVMVNDTLSPLAARADLLIPLCAGVERSVAATKSCISAMVAHAALVAAWNGNRGLAAAIEALPDTLTAALAVDGSDVISGLIHARQMFVIGRGYGLGIAQEVALKLKETCGIQAEAFSAAEVRHGPMAIVGPGFPVLALATSDQAGNDVAAVAAALAERGAQVMLVLLGEGGFPAAEAGFPALEPITLLVAFYRLIERLARARGLDPDTPPHLAKITETT